MTKPGKRTAIICGIALLVLAIGYFSIAKTVGHFLKEGAPDRAIGKKTAGIQFVIENENIDGEFRVGAIPGAREKVFTESRDGYLWTLMKLNGPIHHPREDLHDWLVAAAEEQLTKGFLAPIFKPGKVVLELLKSLYPE